MELPLLGKARRTGAGQEWGQEWALAMVLAGVPAAPGMAALPGHRRSFISIFPGGVLHHDPSSAAGLLNGQGRGCLACVHRAYLML